MYEFVPHSSVTYEFVTHAIVTYVVTHLCVTLGAGDARYQGSR